MNIPNGFKLVPVEPTNEMVAAIQDRITVTSRGGKIGCKAALREAIEVSPAPPQPIYDEAKEQEAFEAVNPMPDHVMKFKGGYAPTGYSAWNAQDFCKKWDGWKQCAQSRAKSVEADHE